MRYGATLIVAMEGMSRTAFRVARELYQNSRSGLTLRFLSKKFSLPEHEIEYLVDLHDNLFYFDLNRVRLVAEGPLAVARVCSGLENHGDVPSFLKTMRNLDAGLFRRLEEQLDLGAPSSRNKVAQALLDKCYKYPDSLVEFVARNSFSKSAREVFDLVWQSPHGNVAISTLRGAFNGSENELEKALEELFQSFVLFELFRFDAEDRLTRFAGILHELRQWREAQNRDKDETVKPRLVRRSPLHVQTRNMTFSLQVCRLVAAIAARPIRIKSNGEFFREDMKRLEEVCIEETHEPSVETLVWAAEGVGWVGRVDDEIRVCGLDELQRLSPIERHQKLFDWFADSRLRAGLKQMFQCFAEKSAGNLWYKLSDFLKWAVKYAAMDDAPELRNAGGHWTYCSPAFSPSFERNIVRALEEELFWLGVIDRAQVDEETVFRLTPLGRFLLTGVTDSSIEKLRKYTRSEILVQPNFEIVVNARVSDPLTTVPLNRFAEKVSGGSVDVYRVTKASFTKALQEGHDGKGFIEFLIWNNKTQELPANVLTTLQDWCGSVKRLRLRTIHVIESDDPLVIADIGSRRRFKKYLRRIESGRVLEYQGVTRRELEKGLEKEGFVVE